MSATYSIVIEFTPDLTGDPDAFRMHRERAYEVEATPDVIEAVRVFEKVLQEAEESS